MSDQTEHIADGFKMTELGPLPYEWEAPTLADVGEIKYGRANPKGSGHVPVVGSGGVFSYTSTPLVAFPTIVIGRKGTAGKVWLCPSPCHPSDTTFYLQWRRDVDVTFLFHFMSLRPLSGDHAKTTLPSLQKHYLEGMIIPLPPLWEQRAIAGVLSIIQTAIEAQDKVVAAARETKKSLMRHLFTYGPVPVAEAEKVPLKDTEIGPVPEHWQVQPLHSTATLQRGKDLPKQNQVPGPYPIVGSSGIIGYHNTYVCDGPGVVTGRSGSIGKLVYVEESYWPHNTGLYVKDFHDNEPRFVFYMLHLVDFRKYATGVSVPTLNRNFVHSALVPVPPTPEQREIASVLSKVDMKIETEEKCKTSLQALFKTMLHHLMTGKVRVNDLEVTAG